MAINTKCDVVSDAGWGKRVTIKDTIGTTGKI